MMPTKNNKQKKKNTHSKVTKERKLLDFFVPNTKGNKSN